MSVIFMKFKHAHIGVLCNNQIPHSATIRFLDLSSIIRVHFPVSRHATLPEKYSLHSENAERVKDIDTLTLQ